MLAHNVAALLKSPLGTARRVDVDEAPPTLGEFRLHGPVQGHARLIRTQAGILARVELEGTVELECARCLEPFAWPFRIDFDEEFQPSLSVATGVPLPAPDDDALRIDERHVLDLSEIARQFLATAVPIQPVCRVDCEGLCPTCGADLNAGPCSCGPGVEANPFASLASLLEPTSRPER